MTGGSYLILGGARSGKSRRALEIGKLFEDRIYIATAQPLDDEMSDRIAAHKRERGAKWQTLEAPLGLVPAIGGLSNHDSIAVIDCLTLWLCNVQLAGLDVQEETEMLLAAVGNCPATLVFVSNELGLGLVPETVLGRTFRDHQGWLNQSLAAAVDHVEFLIAGLPIRIK